MIRRKRSLEKRQPWKRFRKDRQKPLSEEEIEEYIKAKYNKSSETTKEYIKNSLRIQGPSFKFKPSWITRQDVIDEYYKSRREYDYIIKYDFSPLPDIIKSIDEKFEIICTEKIGGVEVGKFTTTYRNFITNKNEAVSYDLLLKSINWDRPEVVEKTQILKDLINKNYPELDPKDVVFLRSDILIKVWCKRCGKSFLTTQTRLFDGKVRVSCPECRIYDKSGVDKSWINRIKEMWEHKLDFSQSNFIGTHNKIKVICKDCGNIFEIFPSVLLRTKYGCPNCAKKEIGKKVSSNYEEFVQKALNYYGEGEYDLSKFTYIDNKTPGTIIDLKTGDTFERTPNAFLSGHANPKRNGGISIGERLTMRVLDELGIVYKREVREYNVEGREDGTYCKIDIETDIDGIDYWIELNGLQHYRYTEATGSEPNLMYKYYSEAEGKSRYLGQLRRDNNVREYCKKNNIILIEIPYINYKYSDIKEILTAILLENKSPEEVIKQPEIEIPV